MSPARVMGAVTIFTIGFALSEGAVAAEEMKPPGVDEHTIALWLFDDPRYYNVVLTDAGVHEIDLRLDTGPNPSEAVPDGNRGLVPGKFGRALHLPLGDGRGVVWPSSRAIPLYGPARVRDRGNGVPELLNLGYLDFTVELWLKASGRQEGNGCVFELRNRADEQHGEKYVPHGLSALVLDENRARFLVISKMTPVSEWYLESPFPKWDLELPIPTDPNKLNDGHWHHLAFTFTAQERQTRHYIDGQLQPLPKKGTFLPLMGQLASFRLGRDADGQQELNGLIDEMRISGEVRYQDSFAPPGSFSRNYGANAPAPGKPNGPPLLFDRRRQRGPEQVDSSDDLPSTVREPSVTRTVNLGSRKHLFIDEALIESLDNVQLTVNPPKSFEVTDFICDRPWEPTPRFGPGIPDICSVFDDGTELRMLYTNGGMWGGKPHCTCLATSKDGLHWEKNDLGVVCWNGSTKNNIVLRNACQGAVLKDQNPDEPPDRRYKYLAWCMNRGFYVFTSPDCVHWRKNETLMLPFDPDGSISAFWDDQCGLYRGYIRAMVPDRGRHIARVGTPEIYKPWPFRPSRSPHYHVWLAPKPSAGELPLLDTGGQVYRFKAVKYPAAPDVYLAFPWRMIAAANVRPGSFLMTSRDGEQWRRYEPPYYFPSGWELEGRKVIEALMEHGIVCRGDEVWHFGTVRFTEHGGAPYGGVEHEGGYFDRLLRIAQRLDGFVSLDAGKTAGEFITRRLVFEGKRLELNIASKGSLRVGILGEGGEPLRGFGVDDCDAIQADSVRHIVTWEGRSDVGAIADKAVRLTFELQDAKLYAMQFAPGD